MTAWYNEPDPYCAQWLRNLIEAGEIAPGVVCEKPIQEVETWELAGFTQCHFFAGIGVWSAALRAAGWSDDWPIWTGSCPCQPFSQVGAQEGFLDDRHLWPFWFDLIRFKKPPVIVGEQVAGALQWLDLVSSDLQRENYAFGAGDICAASFEGAHKRQRLYFVALADAHITGLENREIGFDKLMGPQRREIEERSFGLRRLDGGMAYPHSHGRQLGKGDFSPPRYGHPFTAAGCFDIPGAAHAPLLGRNNVDWLFCRDGKWRPVEPFTFPLVDAAPAVMGRLRAYGNALDLETAKNFCEAVFEIVSGV